MGEQHSEHGRRTGREGDSERADPCTAPVALLSVLNSSSYALSSSIVRTALAPQCSSPHALSPRRTVTLVRKMRESPGRHCGGRERRSKLPQWGQEGHTQWRKRWTQVGALCSMRRPTGQRSEVPSCKPVSRLRFCVSTHCARGAGPGVSASSARWLRCCEWSAFHRPVLFRLPLHFPL